MAGRMLLNEIGSTLKPVDTDCGLNTRFLSSPDPEHLKGKSAPVGVPGASQRD